ncbi:type II toxin-antitoxin system Y4mF family antitoxin [Comamonas sp. J-3]|uniref:type II toxin-antitoxin system Y4mF family antitoxin n=1 Tax=Comamonas trifloxystrobinivorans TaxID=3350256 RepID=UPI003727C7E2
MFNIQSAEQLGPKVRQARKQLGLTQPQLALAAGVGTRFLVDLEAGKATVRLEQVLRVINALGGELQLLGLPGSEAAAEPAQSLPAAKDEHGA